MNSPLPLMCTTIHIAGVQISLCFIIHWIAGLFVLPHAPVMVMQIVLQNDSLINDSRRIYNAGGQKITLHSDSIHPIKEVKGFIYYPAGSLDKIILVDRISLMRHHFRVIPKPVVVSHGLTVRQVHRSCPIIIHF